MADGTMADGADKIVYLDFKRELRRLANNTRIYVKLLRKAKDQCNPQKLGECLAAGNMEEAAHQAHMIRGTSGNISLVELCKLTRELEIQIKSGERVSDLFEKVQSVYELTVKEIDRVLEEYDR